MSKKIIHEYSVGIVGTVEIEEDANGRLGDVKFNFATPTFTVRQGLFKQIVYDLSVVRDFVASRVK